MAQRQPLSPRPDPFADAGAFLFGALLAGVGALLAALWYAPRSGSETRRAIQSRSQEIRATAEQAAAEARQRVEGVSPSDLIATAKADAQRFRNQQ